MLPTIRNTVLVLGCLVLSTEGRAQGATKLDQVLDQVIANERALAETLKQHHPLVETYIQTVKPDPTLGSVPFRDHYFFGRLQLGTPAQTPAAQAPVKKKDKSKSSLSLFEAFHSQTFRPEGFARMLILDRGSFDRQSYVFEFVRSEFLEKHARSTPPKPERVRSNKRDGGSLGGSVEDRDYHVVRYNGVYARPPGSTSTLAHERGPLWLPPTFTPRSRACVPAARAHPPRTDLIWATRGSRLALTRVHRGEVGDLLAKDTVESSGWSPGGERAWQGGRGQRHPPPGALGLLALGRRGARPETGGGEPGGHEQPRPDPPGAAACSPPPLSRSRWGGRSPEPRPDRRPSRRGQPGHGPAHELGCWKGHRLDTRRLWRTGC